MSERQIVVGWAPNRYGEAAVSHALSEADLRGCGIVVVNATRGDALVDDRYAGAHALEDVEAMLSASGTAHEVRQSMGADVAEQILDVAAEVDAPLIVIGLRRRSPVGKLIMGSVAQRILLGAHCPVLAVKPAEAHG
jgi:nucleotide-binding universal stress UspA family protein